MKKLCKIHDDNFKGAYVGVTHKAAQTRWDEHQRDATNPNKLPDKFHQTMNEWYTKVQPWDTKAKRNGHYMFIVVATGNGTEMYKLEKDLIDKYALTAKGLNTNEGGSCPNDYMHHDHLVYIVYK